MPNRVFDLGIRVTAKDDGASGVLGNFHSNLQKLGGIAIAGVGAATTAIIGMGAALTDLAIQAAPTEGIARAFEGISQSVGVGMDEMLKKLQEGSRGMIGNRDLMASFNSAAQLVSKDFAQKLPDAMSFLGKVSAATGQDMGFMLDSLVKGVGRLSPMILDNLGIQVNLEQATAKAADMFGVEAASLSKTQIQAGMMEVVLAKLAENTAAMPDISENASTKIAQLGVTMGNLKGQVGNAVLPILTKFLDFAADAAQKYLPPLVSFIQSNVVPVLVEFSDYAIRVAESLSNFIGWILAGQNPLYALTALLRNIGLGDLAATIQSAIPSIELFVTKAGEILGPIISWVQNNISLNDILIGLGAAVATVVIPVIASLVSTFAPIIAVFAAVVLAVSLVRQAWENDFMGIRSMFERVWEQGILPAFKYMQDELFPRVTAIVEYFGQVWEVKIVPALERAGVQMKGDFIPAIGDLLIGAVGGAVSIIEALIGVIEWLLPLFAEIAGAVGSIIDFFTEWRRVTADLYRWLANLIIPDWLKPGSPTPLEMGVRGIIDAMGELSDQELPALSRAFAMPNPMQPGMAGAGAGAGAGQPLRIEIPLIMDGREVGHASIEGTLDALNQRGKKFRKTTG